MKTGINAQAYKKNGSGIGVLISELFTRSTARITHPSKITLLKDDLSDTKGANEN